MGAPSGPTCAKIRTPPTNRQFASTGLGVLRSVLASGLFDWNGGNKLFFIHTPNDILNFMALNHVTAFIWGITYL